MEFISGLTRDGDAQHIRVSEPSPEISAETAIRDDFASRKARAYTKTSGPRQKFVHFGPVTEIDQQKWKRLSIGKAGPREDVEEVTTRGSKIQTYPMSPDLAATSSLKEDQKLNPQNDCRYFLPSLCRDICIEVAAAFNKFIGAGGIGHVLRVCCLYS